MKSLASVPNVRIAAVCDIYEPHLEEGPQARRPEGSTSAGSIASSSIARTSTPVLIGSPDHWHVPMTIDACSARQGRVRREAADARPR